MPELPSVFIGSSSEGLDVAREVELQLQNHAITTIWKDGVFGLGSGTLESLVRVLDHFDFAIIILSPDDLLESRDRSFASPRDNVIFELGLFMGRLGRRRTIIVHEQQDDLKLPSDLAGITFARYRRRENMSAALSPTCTPIIRTIQELGFFQKATSHDAGVLSDLDRSVQIIDRISGQIVDVARGQISSENAYAHRMLIRRGGDGLVAYQRFGVITKEQLDTLPESQRTHIGAYETSLERLRVAWENLYPQRISPANGSINSEVEARLKQLIHEMRKDLLGILDFLEKNGIYLDDHYQEVRDVLRSAH